MVTTRHVLGIDFLEANVFMDQHKKNTIKVRKIQRGPGKSNCTNILTKTT